MASNSMGGDSKAETMSSHQLLSDFMIGFSKDVIDAQPDDLLHFAAQYFTKKIKCQKLHGSKPSLGLTFELLSRLHTQLSGVFPLSRLAVESQWKALGLPIQTLTTALTSGHFGEHIHWNRFVATCCLILGKSIREALAQACYILNSDPECRRPDACVPFHTFKFLYCYLTEGNRGVTKDMRDLVLGKLKKKEYVFYVPVWERRKRVNAETQERLGMEEN